MTTESPVQTAAEYREGQTVGGRFEILRLLGRGGFGETYAARDLDLGGEVAIKVLQLQRLQDWKALELFEREARVLEELDHPRIPDYVEFLEDPDSGKAYLVQELAPGRPLGEVLSEGRRFDQEETIAIAEQVLEVLVYLESLRPQVVHRDIKPDNLLLDDNSIFVVDFGAVREVARQAGEGSTVAGTFGYMAPEQLMGRATPASDIFGLGMTLVHMLTGQSPERLDQRRGKPHFRTQARVDEWFAEILDEMIEVVVDDRIASAERCLALLAARGTPVPDALTRVQAERMAQLTAQRERDEARRRAREEEQQALIAKAQARQEALGDAVQIYSEGQLARLHLRPPLRRLISDVDDSLKTWFLPLVILSISPMVFYLLGSLFLEPDHLAIARILAIAVTTLISLCSGVILLIMASTTNAHIPRRVRVEVQGTQARLRGTLMRWQSGRHANLGCHITPPDDGRELGQAEFRLGMGAPVVTRHLTPDELDRIEQFCDENGIGVARRRPN